MSAVTSPRGPLPTRVYWTRRVLVAAVALAVVFGLARLIGGGGGDNGPTAQVVGADTSTTATPSAPATSAGTAPTKAAPAPTVSGDATTTTRAKTKTKAATPLPTPSGPCENSDIVATPALKYTPYAGKPVVFAMQLTTRSTAACDWTVSAKSLVVKVTSGLDRIWSTQQCAGAVPKQDVVVRKDTPATVDVAWNGQRSDTGCSRSTAWAEPGYYHAIAAAYGSDPVDEQFRLRTPTRPTVTARPTPDSSTSAAAHSSPSATVGATNRPTGTATARAGASPSKKKH